MLPLVAQSPAGLCLQLTIISLLVHGFYLVQRWYRLCHIPGPKGAGWSSWWQLRGAQGGRYHEHLKNAADEFGLSNVRRFL
jgi:hypothetical protein